MEFLAVLGFTLPFGGLIVFLLFLVALMNEKGVSRGGAIRMAFTYVVSAVMLSIVVSSSIFLVQQALKGTVLSRADRNIYQNDYQYVSQPPTIFLTSTPNSFSQTLYACTDSCQFNDSDKAQLKSWKESYVAWKAQNKPAVQGNKLSDNTKQQLASALSFLIVALPLFIWFFVYMIQKEWRKRQAKGERPGPLRTAYFYFMAFGGLIGLVISAAMLLNVAFKTVLGVQNSSSTPSTTIVVGETNGVQSIVNCSSACGFTQEDKDLAQQWLTDYADWQKKNQSGVVRSDVQNDLANLLPVLLVTAPLFFFHFISIRRETREDHEDEHPAAA